MSERDRNEYYTLLGVSPDATPSQILAAYWVALLATEGSGMEFARKAVEQAFAILGDPTARAAYDATRASGDHIAARYCEDDTEEASLPRQVVNHPRDPKGYYKLLRVPVDASQEEIFAAYFNHHIAKAGGLTGVDTRPLDAVSVAYNVLSDPMLRAAYDPAFLSSGTSEGAQNLRRVFPTFEPPFHAGRGADSSRTRIPDALLQEIAPSPSPKPQGCLGIFLLLITLFMFFV